MTSLAHPRDRAPGQSPQSSSGIASLERVSVVAGTIAPLRNVDPSPAELSDAERADPIRRKELSVVFETLTVRTEGWVLFAEIAAPPMNLLGPELVRDLVSLIQQARPMTPSGCSCL